MSLPNAPRTASRFGCLLRLSTRLLLTVLVGHAVAGQPGGSAAGSRPLAGGLQAFSRSGQVFLTWQEAESPPGTTFNVYVSTTPIRDVAQARRIGHQVERQSAMDWWEDPASFTKAATPDRTKGFRLHDAGGRLDPTGGLFVHTVPADTRDPLHFAVTHTGADGREDRTLIPGVNATSSGVAVAAGPPQAIWQLDGAAPGPGAGSGRALWLSLHGKSAVVRDSEYLAFGDATLGWREGLPFKFSVRIQGDEIVIRPTDRAWINRPFTEAGDSGVPAIWTFWYGYNSHVYDRALLSSGTPTNYTERRLLWILEWVSRHYGADPNRWYCSGSSMGGCGTLSFGWRHPDRFAALHAHVPIVSYTYLGGSSAKRLEPMSGFAPITPAVRTHEGLPLLERMDGIGYVQRATVDLPPLFVVNGRQDNSIPWVNNPPFYRALDQSRQGYAVYWDNENHAVSGKQAPADVAAWQQRFRRFRLDESFPAFSNTSSNRNPGNGEPQDGDLVGWMNRGLDWREIEDRPDGYAITLVADYPGAAYPVHTDVTLRRVQRFKPAPGTRLRVAPGAATATTLMVGPDGRITIPRVAIPAGGVRLVLTRS